MTDRADLLTAADWKVSTGFVLVGVFVLASVVSGVVVGAARSVDLGQPAMTWVVGGAVCAVYVAVLLVLWGLARHKHLSVSEAYGMRPAPAAEVFGIAMGVGLIGQTVSIAWGIATQLLGLKLSGWDTDLTRILPATPLGITFLAVATVMLAPLAEEMVFRGVLFSSTAHEWGVVWGVVVSSVVFGLIHFLPHAIPPVTVFGMMLALVFLRTRSLWVAVATHAAFNAIALTLAYTVRAAGRL